MEIMQQIIVVVLVLALLGGLMWWLRRRGFAGMTLNRRGADRRMECLERLPLGPQHTLHVVRIGATELLLVSSPSGCVLIKDLSQETP
jgi:flagellar biosynthetic protein FliO